MTDRQETEGSGGRRGFKFETSNITFLHFLTDSLKVSMTEQTHVLHLSVWNGGTSYVL